MDGRLYINEEAIRQIMSDLAVQQAQLDEMSVTAFTPHGVIHQSAGRGAQATAELLTEIPACVEKMRALFASHIRFFESVIEGFNQADYESRVAAEELWNTIPGQR